MAIDHLASLLRELTVASPYRTRPISDTPQPPFLNTAVVGATDLDAETLLGFAKGLEWAAGRRRGPRHSARPLDVDLLLLGEQCISTPGLVVPHPRLRERRFALAPLAEIAPHLRVPPDGSPIRQLLELLPDDQGVVRLAWRLPPPAAASPQPAGS